MVGDIILIAPRLGTCYVLLTKHIIRARCSLPITEITRRFPTLMARLYAPPPAGLQIRQLAR
ncbi:hypothetical protein NSND_50235 [Nitrospira sp. ND1]|nr:hypothetical protein NSND_50235 [Nitrospira sp. ND1]